MVVADDDQSIGIDARELLAKQVELMLAAGVAAWPGFATQVAIRVWLPSRPTTTIASAS